MKGCSKEKINWWFYFLLRTFGSEYQLYLNFLAGPHVVTFLNPLTCQTRHSNIKFKKSSSGAILDSLNSKHPKACRSKISLKIQPKIQQSNLKIYWSKNDKNFARFRAFNYIGYRIFWHVSYIYKSHPTFKTCQKVEIKLTQNNLNFFTL